jgi:hypothetical protein
MIGTVLAASQKDCWRNIPITLKIPLEGRRDGASLCKGLVTSASRNVLRQMIKTGFYEPSEGP